ncbi:hypothetical protein [Pelagibacterium sediminicola]|uniref:hypothetical protein n=1 Tax=Pelagibacterium sediminicola TaxID=2248761 RepID=UPI00130044E8|nr:hypothetical protein [Pelagibacterium sediminicola]
MFRNFKSAVVATGLVLATVNAAMAADEIDMYCVGPNNSGYGQMTASFSPTEYKTINVLACGQTIYMTDTTFERLNECIFEIGIDVPVWHGSNRFCTFGL